MHGDGVEHTSNCYGGIEALQHLYRLLSSKARLYPTDSYINSIRLDFVCHGLWPLPMRGGGQKIYWTIKVGRLLMVLFTVSQAVTQQFGVPIPNVYLSFSIQALEL